MFTEGLSWHYYGYKSASPLHSQFDMVEERTDDEHAIVISPPGTIAETTLDLLKKVAAAQV